MILSRETSGLITAIIRLAEFLATAAFDDATWTSVKLVTWSCIEPGMYLIAACLLACRPLIHRALNNFGPLLRLWSHNSSSSTISRGAAARPGIQDLEFQTTTIPKHSYKGFDDLDDDLESLTTASQSGSGDGNYSQALGQGEKDCSRREPAGREEGVIQVTREIVLNSDEPTSPC